MIGWLLRATFGTVVFGITAYVIVMVPVGRRTLLEHGRAIYKTRPAQELAQDISSVANATVSRVRQTVSE